MYSVSNSLRHLWGALFYKPDQWAVLLLGAFFIFGGSIISMVSLDSQGHKLLQGLIETVLLGVGASIFASGLVVKILSRLPRDAEHEKLLQTGIKFIGHRDNFKSEFGPEGESGWDWWIRQTPPGTDLIICGKKNGYWISESWPVIQSVLRKNVKIHFIFIGSDHEVRQNFENFVHAERHVEDEIPSNPDLKCWKYLSDGRDVEDCGFYWNGKSLLVKIYLPGINNYNCPILAFDVPGASQNFCVDDFIEPGRLFLRRAQALSVCARSLDQIWRDKTELIPISVSNATFQVLGDRC